MKKFKNTMKKILFLMFTVSSLSCQINYGSDSQPKELWLTDISQAIALSEATGNPIFAFFTGKEWCGWCKKLDSQILTKESFITYAKENLVLLELDFPRGSRNLPQEQIDLARKFNISGYPTVILMDAETNQIGKTGYQYMSPENYVSHVKSLLKE
tara:strand:+ start:52 stop:519 length:468 start_codon:yes stop_codon:yes gene_type:complete